MKQFSRIFKGFGKLQSIQKLYSKSSTKNVFFAISGLTLLQQMSIMQGKLFCDEIQTDQREVQIDQLKHLIQYEICASDEIKEGEIKEFLLGENKFPIIVTRYNKKLYAIGGTCVYDDKTALKDGVIFGNKLYCPNHGCAYNIESGTAEYAPAMDNLAIFYINEKNSKVNVYVPKTPPVKIRPNFSHKDYNDFRKIVIVGNGGAAQACIETLRSFGYAGEITLICSETKLPYDQPQLHKKIKDLKFENIQLRSEEWYEKYGVNFMLGREVVNINNQHGSPSIELEDGLKIEYDALLISTGYSQEHRVIKGSENKDNILYLKNYYDSVKLKETLKNSKYLTVLGFNQNSMETVSTLRKEYPDLDILVVDENKCNQIEDRLGKEVFNGILEAYLDKGIKFLFNDPIEVFESDEKDQSKINQITFKDGLQVKTDAILFFPNNLLANTEFLENGEFVDNLEFDEFSRLKVDVNMRTEHKRIFSAGKNTSVQYFYNDYERMPCESFNTAYNQGMIAALNMLALNIPFHMVPTQHYNIFENNIQSVGYAPMWNDVHIVGDPSTLDFMAIYAYQDSVLHAIGSQKYSKELKIINEAFRLDIMPPLSEIKSQQITLNELASFIRQTKRSGCFKDLIHSIKQQPVEKDVLWLQRETNNEYYNFWKEGMTPDFNARPKVEGEN